MHKPMVTRVSVIVLWGGILAAGVLPAEGWDGSSDLYRLDEALRLHYAAAEPVREAGHGPGIAFTAVPPGNLVPLANRDATSQPLALPSEFAPAAPLAIETTAETLDQPETLDFDVPIMRTAKVDKHVQFFSLHIRNRFEMWLGRLERYRPMVEEIFTEFNLPVDLIFLSLVESGFSTNAVSRAKAVGPWQFIKGTAKAYDLRVDNWIDERRDPVKSTIAAARYLRDLYQLFGSWPLAMAAYNAGERKVGRALVRAQADDFWDLTDTKLLKIETKEYVPRFLAATLIAKDPARFGFAIPSQAPVEYEEVIVTHPIHLKTAALAAGVSYEELKVLNPELRKDLTPPDPAYHLKVPTGRKDAFLANLATYQAWKRVHAVRYQVRRGDTLPLLASRHRTTVAAILEANAMAKSEKPKPGDWLLIPKAVKPKDSTMRALVKASR
jgi:membrane-bound lytic murein transglycosylase D